MKEQYSAVLGANSVHYGVTSEPGLDGMRHLPVIDPQIGETMLFHCADINAIENITRHGFDANRGRNYGPENAPRYGMLGQGSYFSNQLAKGLTYTRCVLCGDYACACRSLETHRKLARATIMSRVILGNVRYYPALASIRKKFGQRQRRRVESQFRPIRQDDNYYSSQDQQQFDSAVSHGFSLQKFFSWGSQVNEFMSPKNQLTYPEFVVTFVMGHDDVAPTLSEIVRTVLRRYQGRSFRFFRRKSTASSRAEELLGAAVDNNDSDKKIGDLVLYLVGVKQHVDGMGADGFGQLKTSGTLFRHLTEELQKHGYLAVA